MYTSELIRSIEKAAEKHEACSRNVMRLWKCAMCLAMDLRDGLCDVVVSHELLEHITFRLYDEEHLHGIRRTCV